MKRQFFGAIAFALLTTPAAKAAVTIMDKDDWKINMYGFVETDVINDSTRSFTEVIGNAPVGRSGTFVGDNGRTAFSDRNSRLGFAVLAPEQDGWKTKGVLELDFFGYNPAPPGPANGANSEAAFYQNPTPRIRHAYMSAESNDWQYLAGQTWSLFGWQPYYFPTLITISPAPGELFQRNLQLTALKALTFGDSNKIQLAGSLERPAQRDSGMPNLTIGARWSLDSYRSGYAATTGDLKSEPLSVGLSGKFTQFTSAQSTTSTSSMSHINGSAFAADILVPLIPNSDPKDKGNSLTLTGEFSAGKGYADSLPNWTGGFTSFTATDAGASVAARTNLDAGFGGFTDAAGNNFDLIQLQTWNVSLQYVLPSTWKSWMTLGFTETQAVNMGQFNFSKSTAAGNGTGVYDKSQLYFINFMHDLTNQIRVGLEYSHEGTHYFTDGENDKNDRYQFSAYYRF